MGVWSQSSRLGQMGCTLDMLRLFVLGACVLGAWAASVQDAVDQYQEAFDDFEALESLIKNIGIHDDDLGGRVKRGAGDRGVTNLDIRDALLQMLKTMRDNYKKIQRSNFQQHDKLDKISAKLDTMTGSSGMEKKIDNISTFLLRMNNKIDAMSRDKGRKRGGSSIQETL